MRLIPRLVLVTLFLVSMRCAHRQAWTAPGVKLTVADPAGVVPKTLEQLEVGDSLAAGISGAAPNVPVEFLLEDERGREWSYMRARSDARGTVEPALFWYQSGVIGTTTRQSAFRPDPAFTTFEEADRFFAGNSLRLTVREAGGRELARQTFRPQPRRTPFLYPSNAEGVLENAVDAGREDLHVSGRNFPAGATVNLFVVPNRFAWREGDPLDAPEGAVRTIRLGAGETSFTARVWDRRLVRPGAYDIVARVGDLGRPVLTRNDVVSFGEDTAVLLYVIINGNVVIDAAGRMKDSPAYFEFSDSFEKGQDVYAALDPTDVPAMHPGGNYAAYWVVADQPEAFWDAMAPPALVDVSVDGRNLTRVKYSCLNGSTLKIWAGATQTLPIAAYDVVVDFGSVPANVHTDFRDDNTYNKGTDFVDGYDTEGFWVFEDPGSPGPMPVGTVEYLDPNGISGITDPAGITGPTTAVTLAWARIMYPATVAGVGQPVAAGGPFPVALFLHGRHERCDDDGSGPLLNGSFTMPCPQAQRVPSHEGYNYIMERLASQGIFCISINAYDIQPGLGSWDYSSRGRLILKFLDKLRDWTNAPVDPFGAIFNGKLDMTRVALSGHSRGGEGVVAAQQLNLTWPNPHSILAVNAIAPTDQDVAKSWIPTSSYFLLLGARDGDLDTMPGFRTYDRAFPDGMANRKPKALAYVYGANHNYFNTVWTPAAELGTPNPWSGSKDDCTGGGCGRPMYASTQRRIGLTTIAAFFRWQLQGIVPYREIFTGRVQPAGIFDVFWTLQDPDRKAIDNFEQLPLNAGTNTVAGSAAGPGFSTFGEALLNAESTDYTPVPAPVDRAFHHDTVGLKLAWAAPQTYTTNIPPGPHRDVSMFTHVTFRAAKKVTGAVTLGPDVRLFVTIEDNMGRTGTTAWSSQFGRIPHPFFGSEKPNLAQMSGIRIPLRLFTRNNSQVDLTNIVRITIATEGAGEIGIDDLEFGK